MTFSEEWNWVVLVLLGVAIGGIPTGVWLTRRKYGIDVREMGSGNIGATNVTRVFGWYAGVVVFLFDFLKGYMPLYFVTHFPTESPWKIPVLGIALVFGHCFSPYLRFKGGKGVATSMGCFAAVAPWAALGAGVTYGGLLVYTRISAVGSLGGLIYALGYLAIVQPPRPMAVLGIGICAIVLIRHVENIRRLTKSIR